MKKCKRLTALLLTVCLLLSCTALTAGAVETDPFRYDFRFQQIVTQLYEKANGSNLLASNAATKILPQLDGLHDGEYIQWDFNSGSVTYGDASFQGSDYDYYFRTRSIVGDWVAFDLDNPGEGSWQLTLEHLQTAHGAKQINVYILPAGNSDAANGMIPANLVHQVSCYSDSNDSESPKTSKYTSVDTTFDVLWQTGSVEQYPTYTIVFQAVSANDSDNTSAKGNGELAANMYLLDLEATKAVASVGDEGYTSVEAAVEAAATATDKTVTLIDNVTEDVALTEGVTLDLNGKTLTGTISVDGAKVKDSSNGSGLLKCEKSESGIFEADNGSYLPLYDDSKEGYRFFSYSAVAYQAKGEVTGTAQSAKFWFDIEFGSATDAYGLLDDLAVNLSLDWSTNEGAAQNYGFASSVVSAWAGAEADGTSTNYALYVTVTGIEALSANDTVSITPSATANGATISFKTITYTVQ